MFALNSTNAILEFILEGTPSVKENLVDSRKEVDKQLKISCEDFISHCTDMMCLSLLTFLDKVSFNQSVYRPTYSVLPALA